MYVSEEQIAAAREWDLYSYLERFEPDELVRTGRNSYRTRTHDSLKITNGMWYWWSHGIGGRTALDYLIKVQGMTFLLPRFSGRTKSKTGRRKNICTAGKKRQQPARVCVPFRARNRWGNPAGMYADRTALRSKGVSQLRVCGL